MLHRETFCVATAQSQSLLCAGDGSTLGPGQNLTQLSLEGLHMVSELVQALLADTAHASAAAAEV